MVDKNLIAEIKAHRTRRKTSLLVFIFVAVLCFTVNWFVTEDNEWPRIVFMVAFIVHLAVIDTINRVTKLEDIILERSDSQ